MEARAQNPVPAAVPAAGDRSRTGVQIGVLLIMTKARSTRACCPRVGKKQFWVDRWWW